MALEGPLDQDGKGGVLEPQTDPAPRHHRRFSARVLIEVIY